MKKHKTVFLLLLGLGAASLTIFYFNGRSLSEDHPHSSVTVEASPSHDLSEETTETVDFEALTIRDSVLQLTGHHSEDSLESRLAALSSLPTDLNSKELETIYTGVLEEPRPEAFSSRAWHAFFNDVLNALVLEQKKPVMGLPDRLMAILQNEGRHRVIRDYALQHLLAFAEYRMDDASRVVLLEAAWEAIADTRDSFRGTYLVAISYKAGEPGWPAAEDVSVKAWEVASAVDAHVLSRITALQVCGKLGYKEALPLAVAIAGDADAHMTLRTSAIATVGDLGKIADQNFLTELADRSPPRLRVAIDAALKRIESKG